MISAALKRRRTVVLLLILLACLVPCEASSGDRNPTFQHCLKGCVSKICESSNAPALPPYLSLFRWTCEDNCKYHCVHSFTDNIPIGGQWHQFYGKWPFYRLGPIQEPLSVMMSLGNLYINLRGIFELKRRVREDNKLSKWLKLAGWCQVNTWFWSTVFHTRDTPITERLDYFSATITVAVSLLYAILRVFHLQTPVSTSRLACPISIGLAVLIMSHFTYLLSFPLGSFPYGYHTKFVIALAMVHNIIWILWSLSFHITLPTLTVRGTEIRIPAPYPPNDPRKVVPPTANTPAFLVLLTTLAMSFEILDFPPFLRIADAHAIWHGCTIPLAVAWWSFFCTDAIDFEGSLLDMRGGGVGVGMDEKMPLSGGAGGHTGPVTRSMAAESPRTPLDSTSQLGAIVMPSSSKSPGKDRLE
ncbi:Per1-like-domain-containing protein [Kockovaella imperatae]|uniref:Post-GPI attachment to proteins factor 3 n=1 Tax=Kockovaella imperatae TaxID=4999 RepID=A0A1Y1UBR4_9TREE|nr:Per1-like-domain-containing protein [Kockovaella imperatae]ORX35481.1 Per1-like-domain-containing protein [Kockovaella imperatae]